MHEYTHRRALHVAGPYTRGVRGVRSDPPFISSHWACAPPIGGRYLEIICVLGVGRFETSTLINNYY